MNPLAVTAVNEAAVQAVVISADLEVLGRTGSTPMMAVGEMMN